MIWHTVVKEVEPIFESGDIALSSRTLCEGEYVGDVLANGERIFTTDVFPDENVALESARSWLYWRDNVAKGAESIYYILAIPITWPGPASQHPYSGLHFKVGRTNDIRRRLQNLRTGTSDELIVHALEPGNAEIEQLRHEQFRRDRRHGEWFAASPELCRHVMSVWQRHRMLPPEHQQKLAALPDRIRIYRSMREALGSAPDMVNPSLSEPWSGSVFLDLVYRKLSDPEHEDE